jgi:hypothetical protein
MRLTRSFLIGHDMIFVDNAAIPAKVWNQTTGRHVTSRWHHLVSDELDPHELIVFAVQRLKLKAAYFQTRPTTHPLYTPAYDHFDLTDRMRFRAIQLGACPIDAELLGAIMLAKTQRYHESRRVWCSDHDDANSH